MKPAYASLCGALTGFLFTCAVCLIQSIPFFESIFRIFIVSAAGAWMGILLAWLNQLLPTKSGHGKEHLDTNL